MCVCVPGKDKKGVGGAEKRKNKEKAASKKETKAKWIRQHAILSLSNTLLGCAVKKPADW